MVTQCEDDEEEDEDDDEDMSESNTVFGITTVINVTNKPDVGCIQQMQSYFLGKAEQHATEATRKLLRDIMTSNNKPLGFLINERFVNIPPQISVPLLESLLKEVRRANEKKMPYNFVYYLMMVKFYRKGGKKNKAIEDLYSNAEEEAICSKAVASFEYSVASETDSGVSGDWLEGDSLLTPYRKIVLFDAKDLPNMINSIKELIEP